MWTHDMAFTRQNDDNVLNVGEVIEAEKTCPCEEIVDASFLGEASGKA